jgi:hypothetical protein
MQNRIKDYLEQLNLVQKQSYKNLAVYPLLSEYVVVLEYLILDEAMSQDVIEVVEIDQGGSVPRLKVINKSNQMVLILDGEELVGAKQNRIVNTTILIAANATTVIPVSCVEQGRWAYTSKKFHSHKRMMSPVMRSMKADDVSLSLKQNGNFQADQSIIWGEISKKADRMNVVSKTMALTDIYSKETPAIKEYVEQFRWIDRQVGAVFAINGEIVGMDCFGKPDTFEKNFKKIVESYALDAIDMFDPKDDRKAKKQAAKGFLKHTADCNFQSFPSVGLGTDYRMDSNHLTGFAFLLEDKLLHLSAFTKTEISNTAKPTSRLQRFSARRGRRIY